jgi:hypothetical protein
MAARRKRATVQRGASIKAARMKAAGLLAHNRRVFSAVNSRFMGSKERSMGLAAAKMTRLRRKVRAVNPRLSDRRRVGIEATRSLASAKTRHLSANPAKVSRRPARMYKRDSRGRFARR